MNGYVMLLCYRYMNLCVKAEPVSLLPVTVIYGDDELKMEDVADVAQPNERQMLIAPKSQDFLFEIGKGIAATHPEFKQDLVDDDYLEEEKEEREEQDKEKWILLTMPDVDKDRRDALTDAVKVLYDETKVKIDFCSKVYLEKVTISLAGASEEEIKEAKEELENVVNQYSDLAKKYREDKEKEIEDAYQLYLKEQGEKEKKEQEQKAATNEEASLGFDINQFAED